MYIKQVLLLLLVSLVLRCSCRVTEEIGTYQSTVESNGDNSTDPEPTASLALNSVEEAFGTNKWRDYTYKPETQSFYKMHKEYKSWLDAKAICESEDAVLFIPENREEAAMIKEWWGQHSSEDMSSRIATFIHVGLTDAVEEGAFVAVDGRPMSQVYNKWHDTEPNNYENEDCVDLLYNLNLMDSKCDSAKEERNDWVSYIPFVCKKKLADIKDGRVTAEISVVKSNEEAFRLKKWRDYTYKPETQSFYKMHKEYKSWLDAKAICESEDAILFIPENREEAAMIKWWWGQHSSEDMSSRTATFIHVGLTDAEVEGEFVTVDGRPMSQVYNKWHDTEPNNYENEDCVDLLYNLNLMDSKCDSAKEERNDWVSYIPFVCKKKLADIKDEGAAKVWKDYSYIEKTNRFYKLHDTPKTWREAAKTCKDEGAILFHPENYQELVLVKNWWKICRDGVPCLSESAEIHVGLTDEEIEGKFKTIDGIHINEVFNKWQEGQPDNNDSGYEEDCVMLRTHVDILSLNDIDCEGRAPMTRYPFVCKQELNWNTVCGKNEESDYKYIGKMNKFYKIHNDPKSWLDAEQNCKDEGATLFHPGSTWELNVVKNWWKNCKHGSNCLPENAEILVGITDQDDEGNFKTVNGKPIKDVYHKWQKGQPDNSDSGYTEDCGMLRRDNTLNDIHCYGLAPMSKYPYICTKECPPKDSELCKVPDSKKNYKQWRDYEYKPQTDSFYKIHAQKKSWLDAKAQCESEDSLLFYPEDEQEAQMIRTWWGNVFSDADMTPRDFPFMHIGVSDLNSTGYETVDRKPIEDVYHKWGAGEPNNAGGIEHCGQLCYNLDVNDVKCDGKASDYQSDWFYLPYMCKKKLSKKNYEKWSDYKYKPQTDSFYKIHAQKKSWLDAKSQCESEDSLLFYPEDEEEAQMIRTWWGNVFSDADMTPRDFPFMHIGVSDLNSAGYETVDGKPVEDVYHKWGPGEPNNAGGIEHCGQLCYNLDVNDVKCDGKESDYQSDWFYLPYMCKKKLSQKSTYYEYKSQTNSYYKIHSQKKSWLDAKAQCESEDALLFYPNDEDEAKMIRTWWKNVFPEEDMTPRDFPFIHVGVTDLNSAGNYKTVDGKPIRDVYHKWGAGEPNNAGGIEHCGQLCYNLDVNDVKCDGKESDYQRDWFVLPYICKKNSVPKKIETNYQHSSKTGSCYSLQLEPLTWKDAEAACAEDNSHLAIINSPEEAEFLSKLVADAPTAQVSGEFLRGAVHLGFRFYKGYWETVRGDLLSSIKYVNWGYLQPDGNGEENCGSMFHSGRLNDIRCDAKALYICERDYEYLHV